MDNNEHRTETNEAYDRIDIERGKTADNVLDVDAVDSTESVEPNRERTTQREREVGGVTIFEGEELHHDIQPPWTAYWWDLLLGTCLIWFFVGAYWYYKAYKKRKNSRYIITSNRIIIKTGGISGSSTEEYRFENVDRVSTSQGLIEGIFDKGTVEFTLREELRDEKHVMLDAIREYDAVKTTIRREQYKETN